MIYLELFLVFLKIGAFTFGGGFAMLPLVQEAVLKKGWIAEETIVDFIAVRRNDCLYVGGFRVKDRDYCRICPH